MRKKDKQNVRVVASIMHFSLLHGFSFFWCNVLLTFPFLQELLMLPHLFELRLQNFKP
jgi:hypothetical protein